MALAGGQEKENREENKTRGEAWKKCAGTLAKRVNIFHGKSQGGKRVE